VLLGESSIEASRFCFFADAGFGQQPPTLFSLPAVLEAVRNISSLSDTQRQRLEAMAMSKDARLVQAVSQCTSAEQLHGELVRLADADAAAATPMDVDATPAAAVNPLLAEIDTAVAKLGTEKPEIAKNVLKTLVTILQDPDKHRRLLTKNMVYKKFIMDVPSSLKILQLCGYHTVEVATKEYLEASTDGVAPEVSEHTLAKLKAQMASTEQQNGTRC